jgi:hypothetical protein
MLRFFTLRLFAKHIHQFNRVAPEVKAPENSVRFVKDFLKSYENLPLKTCTHTDLVKN